MLFALQGLSSNLAAHCYDGLRPQSVSSWGLRARKVWSPLSWDGPRRGSTLPPLPQGLWFVLTGQISVSLQPARLAHRLSSANKLGAGFSVPGGIGKDYSW